ncbi:hypothetical protein [Saccharopolyspora phatthalungensis]|uniref:Uncharacterized protein n=1 Tax=Saccharopolyspora phatthalungensis TaxID=664693 RepID=A0A840Q4U1_9PSEU|nr:hypothetical protein [Saccharopolyspora phatthalungensis]MBB5157522.1 hypothetical protein [Saccharopolyspora phatthalungensis]
MKLSTGKLTAPGAKQVYRGEPGQPDVLALRTEKPPAEREPLLHPVMCGGVRLTQPESIPDAQQRFEHDLRWLPVPARLLTGPIPVDVTWTPVLVQSTEALHRSLAARHHLERAPNR